jgi:uncharacterized membrane protein
MQPKLPYPQHYSYLRHRQQRNRQIILPVVVSALLLIAAVILISFATFKSDGDVARWAAVSAIWISIPILLGGLITLALLVALVYGMARALDALPHYTGIAQDYIYVARSYIIRGADAVSNFLIEFESFFANIKSFFQRIIP